MHRKARSDHLPPLGLGDGRCRRGECPNPLQGFGDSTGLLLGACHVGGPLFEVHQSLQLPGLQARVDLPLEQLIERKSAGYLGRDARSRGRPDE